MTKRMALKNGHSTKDEICRGKRHQNGLMFLLFVVKIYMYLILTRRCTNISVYPN
jgi:hypothetical protein